VGHLKNLEWLFVFASSRIELDNGRVSNQSARPKFAAAPRSFVRKWTKNDAVGRGAIHVHLLPVTKIKVAEMYTYARSAGAPDD
jgi:hypothetical protein